MKSKDNLIWEVTPLTFLTILKVYLNIIKRWVVDLAQFRESSAGCSRADVNNGDCSAAVWWTSLVWAWTGTLSLAAWKHFSVPHSQWRRWSCFLCITVKKPCWLRTRNVLEAEWEREDVPKDRPSASGGQRVSSAEKSTCIRPESDGHKKTSSCKSSNVWMLVLNAICIMQKTLFLTSIDEILLTRFIKKVYKNPF